MTDKPKTFKQTLEQIERIVQEIERGEVGLEESVDRYETGMELISQARAILSSAEQKIQKLQAGKDDSPALEPFEARREGRDQEQRPGGR
jgi:exodeoxyribonuclease VII small subunit